MSKWRANKKDQGRNVEVRSYQLQIYQFINRDIDWKQSIIESGREKLRDQLKAQVLLTRHLGSAESQR